MFRSRTLFIFGAGASKDAGLPLGESLKQIIGKKLDIRYEHGFRRNSGDVEIDNVLQLHAKRVHGKDVNELFHAGRQISAGISQAISIDHYMHAHQDNPDIVLCAKLGIVRSILEAESSSKLFIDPRQTGLNFSKLEGT